MKTYLILASMNVNVVAESGNVYDNFQFMGYVRAEDHAEAVHNFFDEPQFPLDWADIKYLWSESLEEHENNGHYGEFHKISTQSLIHNSNQFYP